MDHEKGEEIPKGPKGPPTTDVDNVGTKRMRNINTVQDVKDGEWDVGSMMGKKLVLQKCNECLELEGYREVFCGHGLAWMIKISDDTC